MGKWYVFFTYGKEKTISHLEFFFVVQIELLCKDGSKIAASCWLTPAESEENCDLYVVVIEPVQRVVSHLSLDEFGMILQADETAFSLFHCIEKEIIGHNIVKWIPNILLPSSGDSLSDVSIAFNSFLQRSFKIGFNSSGNENSKNNRLH